MSVKNHTVNDRESPCTAVATSPTQGESGFTLLEVLVAVVILSIGLLGLAGLQATSLRNNQDALTRSHEALLAYDMIDRMRANIPGVNAGDYHLPTSTQDTDCTTTTGCTPDEMADHDYFEWLATIAAELPAGEGVVCVDSTPGDGTDAANPACDNSGNLFAIKLWWDDDRDSATAKQRFTTSFQP